MTPTFLASTRRRYYRSLLVRRMLDLAASVALVALFGLIGCMLAWGFR